MTQEFLVTVSLEILTFLLNQAKFNASAAGKSTELPALNLASFSRKVKISELIMKCKQHG